MKITKEQINEILKNQANNSTETKAYYSTIEKYLRCFENNDVSDSKVLEFLKRGICIPINLSEDCGGILCIGANPSFKENFPKENFAFIFSEVNDQHWKRIHKLIDNTPDATSKGMLPSAYLDLFPIKQTSLNEFEKVFWNDPEIKAELLKITHERIVTLRPKIIINYYQSMSYYWGTKDTTWFGYTFETIGYEGLDVRKITGHKPNSIISEHDPWSC